MAHYNWNPATASDYPGAVLVATADDGAVIRLHLDAFDDEVEAAFVIEARPGRFVTTEESSCWPAVERYIPREEWTPEMYGSLDVPSMRRPDPAVTEAIDAYRRAMLDALDD